MMRWIRNTGKTLLLAGWMLAGLAAPARAEPMMFCFDNSTPPIAQPKKPETPVAAPSPPRGERSETDRQVDQAYEHISRGRHQEALALFQQILKKDPANKRARFGLAAILIQAERYGEARDLLEALIAEDPKDFSVKNNLAWLFATAKDHSIRNGTRALDLAQDALLLAPDNHHVWSTLAEAYYILGQYPRALRAAQIALRLAEQRAGTERNLAEYRRQYEKCRRAADAMSILE